MNLFPKLDRHCHTLRCCTQWNHPQHDAFLSFLLEASALIRPPPYALNSFTIQTSALLMSPQAVAIAPDSMPTFFPNPDETNSHLVPLGDLGYNKFPAQSLKLVQPRWCHLGGHIVRKHFAAKADAIMHWAREWQAKGHKAQSLVNRTARDARISESVGGKVEGIWFLK